MSNKVAKATPYTATVWRIEDKHNLFGVDSATVTFNYWRVMLTAYGELKCCGNSDGDRCWPFYQHGVCKHTQAVEAFLDGERTAEKATRKLSLVVTPTHALRLVDLFELSERTSRIERE